MKKIVLLKGQICTDGEIYVHCKNDEPIWVRIRDSGKEMYIPMKIVKVILT